MGEFAIFDQIADMIATARTTALMGQRDEAHAIAKEAAALYEQNSEAISRADGHRALMHSFESLQDVLRRDGPGE